MGRNQLKQNVLVTHVRPHVDDVVGLWLFKRYRPGWKDARIVFLNLEAEIKPTYRNEPVDSNPKVVHIGMAAGMFDEHHLKRKTTATTLVWEFLKKKKNIPKKDQLAIQKIVDYVYEEDTGAFKNVPTDCRIVSFGAILNGASDDRYTLGFQMLDALLNSMRGIGELEKDWKNRTEFKTKWGNGVGFETRVSGGDAFAYGHGFEILAQVNTKHGYRSVKGRSTSNVDLTKAFKKVRELEPEAGWYLHQSKKLLLAGSSSAPDVVKSNLTLKELIAVLKEK